MPCSQRSLRRMVDATRRTTLRGLLQVGAAVGTTVLSAACALDRSRTAATLAGLGPCWANQGVGTAHCRCARRAASTCGKP